MTRADVCIIACAEAFRGDGEILASPMGPIPAAGARLARLTFEPDLLMTDGIATLVDTDGNAEGRMNYRRVFDVVWSGKRHVMMGASQVDRLGRQNISCIGDWARPKVMLLGARGAPGNTISHATSYFIARHGPRIFVERVDFASGVGTDATPHLRRVVSDLGVFDFATPDGSMRLASLHPGVDVATVVERTGFALTIPDDVPTTRLPTAEEQRLIDEVIDPDGTARATVKTT